MCITPSFIWVARGAGWDQLPKPCGDCWRCRSNRVNDYVGRCLAEAAYSDWTITFTLTYAPRDDLADKVINKSHFQDFIRSMRDAHHKIRYIAVGEYGKLNGRAHFHTIIFGRGKRIDVPLNENFQFKHWPHGHSFADGQALGNSGADERAIRYICKYLLKGEKGLYWFTLSKKPVLGAEFFIEKAKRDSALGVLPSTFSYFPPGGTSGREYLLSGASRRLYLETLFPDGFTLDDPSHSDWLKSALSSLNRHHARKRHDVHDDETFHEELDKRQRVMKRYMSINERKSFAKKLGLNFVTSQQQKHYERTGIIPDECFKNGSISIPAVSERSDRSSSQSVCNINCPRGICQAKSPGDHSTGCVSSDHCKKIWQIRKSET